MERHFTRLTTPAASRRAHLRLAALHGRRLPGSGMPATELPERPMAIAFEGLTEAEQRAALAAFPGGRRFVLTHSAGR